MKKSPKKPKHYVNNKQLLEELIGFKAKVQEAQEKGLTRPRMPNYIGECLLLIATRLANKPNFYNYSYKEEMIADGIENCCIYIDNFDPTKSSNPFAYFTQVIAFSFIRRITREKKQQYIKIKNMQNYFSDETEWLEASQHNRFSNEITDEYVRSFEAGIASKKKRDQKPAGVELLVGE